MSKYVNPENKRWYEILLTWFGDLKFFKFPPILVYDPGSYKVKGEDTREVIDIIQKGDIVLRAYDHYIDGLFIPGLFSHVGFFYGNATARDRKSAGTMIDDNPEKLARVQKEEFKTGKQMMIHAMADGVFMEDVINFCRCDRMVILRLPEMLEKSKPVEKVFNKTRFLPSEEKIYQKLNRGDGISRKEATEAARKVALTCLGARYDFRFDFKDEPHNSFSCSELAYYAYRSIARCINLQPEKTCLANILFCKQAIVPDKFLDAGFELVWASRSVRNHPKIKGKIKDALL
ncbi:MAG TPA: hypothetical protein VKA31_05205 [Mariprofundaceae bacterium]|nr:hypothetical protein [Mariprofundaceae bacterium]